MRKPIFFSFVISKVFFAHCSTSRLPLAWLFVCCHHVQSTLKITASLVLLLLRAAPPWVQTYKQRGHDQICVLSEPTNQPWLFVGLLWNIAFKDTPAQSLRAKDLSNFKAAKLKNFAFLCFRHTWRQVLWQMGNVRVHCVNLFLPWLIRTAPWLIGQWDLHGIAIDAGRRFVGGKHAADNPTDLQFRRNILISNSSFSIFNCSFTPTLGQWSLPATLKKERHLRHFLTLHDHDFNQDFEYCYWS